VADRKLPPPKQVFLLFDSQGEWCGTYMSMEAAEDDAWGPRFRPSFTIRTYRLVPREAE